MRDPEPWTREYLESQFKNKDPWRYFRSPYEQRKYQRQIDLIADRIPDPQSILEIGSAEGAHSLMLAKRFPGARITDVEISSRAVERAKEVLSPYGHRIVLINADIIDYHSRLPRSGFDVCLWSESVYYVGSRLSLTGTYEMMEAVMSKLNGGGIMVMANVVDLPSDVPEWPLTRRPLIDCYHSMLSSLAVSIDRSVYHEMKGGRSYEYQIWAFLRRSD